MTSKSSSMLRYYQFVIVTMGSVVVTVNCKLLGGKVSFFQSL